MIFCYFMKKDSTHGGVTPFCDPRIRPALHHHPKTDVDFVSDDEYSVIYFAVLTQKLRCCCYFICQNSQLMELDWIFLMSRKSSEPLRVYCYLS